MAKPGVSQHFKITYPSGICFFWTVAETLVSTDSCVTLKTRQIGEFIFKCQGIRPSNHSLFPHRYCYIKSLTAALTVERLYWWKVLQKHSDMNADTHIITARLIRSSPRRTQSLFWEVWRAECWMRENEGLNNLRSSSGIKSNTTVNLAKWCIFFQIKKNKGKNISTGSNEK